MAEKEGCPVRRPEPPHQRCAVTGDHTTHSNGLTGTFAMRWETPVEMETAEACAERLHPRPSNEELLKIALTRGGHAARRVDVCASADQAVSLDAIRERDAQQDARREADAAWCESKAAEARREARALDGTAESDDDVMKIARCEGQASAMLAVAARLRSVK